MTPLRFLCTCFVFFGAPLLAHAFAPPFDEDFDNNKVEWIEKTSNTATTVTSIANQKLHYENLSAEANGLKWQSKPMELEAGRDFEITLRLKITDGPEDAEVGLIWDYNSTIGNGLRRHFHVMRSGKYHLFFNDGSQFTGRDSEQKSPALHPGEDNELTVRVIGKRVFYVINGTAVDADDFSGLRGKYVGYSIASGVTVDIDHFHVHYLDGTPESRVADARKLEGEVTAALIAVGPPLQDFVETFDDNHHEWQKLGDGENWSAKIANGVLEWNNKRTDEAKQRSFVKLPFNGAADFDVSFRARRVAGAENTFFGLAWGWPESHTDAYEFGIAPQGYYLFGTSENSVYDQSVPWTETTLVKKSEFNELRARKLGQTLFLFVNGQVVTDTPAKPLLGAELSTVVSQGTTAAFDDIRVTYPKQTEQQSAAEKEKYIAALKAGHGKEGLGIVYSVAKRQDIIAAQSKKDLQDIEDQRWKLTDADQKQLTKVRKQFEGKKLLSLYADWQRPASISTDGYRVYYNYKLVGRTQYYYEFQILKAGSDQKTWLINAVQHTDKRW